MPARCKSAIWLFIVLSAMLKVRPAPPTRRLSAAHVTTRRLSAAHVTTRRLSAAHVRDDPVGARRPLALQHPLLTRRPHRRRLLR
eukprot:4308780-Prymnesium_polylepis.1